MDTNIAIGILGGGPNQLPLFQAAKQMGYRTVLLDEKSDVACKGYADEYHQGIISDPDNVISLLREVKINGIVSNTESLMQCLSIVQRKLDLCSNPPAAVEKLIDKYQFRQMEKEVNLFAPNIIRVSCLEEANDFLTFSRIPSILKPEESSGSRGTYVLQSKDDLTEEKFNDCIKHSRTGVALIEDYINIQDKPAIEAEMFILNGKIEYLCCFRTIRDLTYKTIPQCYCSDTEIDEVTLKNIYEALEVLVHHIGILWGEYNVELSFTDEGKIFIIEINARQGGMKLPEFVKAFSGIDMNMLLVSTAVRDMKYIHELRGKKCIIDKNVIHFRLLCENAGYFNGISLDTEARKYLVGEFYYFTKGEYISPAFHSMASVGVLDFKFPSQEIRKKYEKKLFSDVSVLLE